MSTKLPVNRIENALEEWQKREERFGKIFSSDILKNKPFLQEKLKYFDAIQVRFGRTLNDEERLALRMEQGRKNGLSI